MKHAIALALLLAVTAHEPPYPGRVTIRGREWHHVQGQPARNWLRFFFGGVPVPPKAPMEK